MVECVAEIAMMEYTPFLVDCCMTGADRSRYAFALACISIRIYPDPFAVAPCDHCPSSYTHMALGIALAWLRIASCGICFPHATRTRVLCFFVDMLN